MADGFIQRQRTALGGAQGVGECNGCRIEVDPCGTIACPACAMASRTLRRVQGGGFLQIRRLPGRSHHAISGQHLICQGVCGTGHDVAGRMLRHQLHKCITLLKQGHPLRVVGQGGNARACSDGKLAHFGIFALAHHLAVDHGLGVIHRDVVQQLPRLPRIAGTLRRSHHAAARRQQQHYQQTPKPPTAHGPAQQRKACSLQRMGIIRN